MATILEIAGEIAAKRLICYVPFGTWVEAERVSTEKVWLRNQQRHEDPYPISEFITRVEFDRREQERADNFARLQAEAEAAAMRFTPAEVRRACQFAASMAWNSALDSSYAPSKRKPRDFKAKADEAFARMISERTAKAAKEQEHE